MIRLSVPCLQALCLIAAITVIPSVSAQDSTAPKAAGKSRPNIILFLIDDMGWGDLGAFGHPYAKTPNIDKMAQKGTLFKNFYTTSPVCSPSRTSFITGNYPAVHRVHHAFGSPKGNAKHGMPNYLDPSVNLISRTLQQNGYLTAHFGKWHLSCSPKDCKEVPNPAKYAFDEFRTYHTYFPDVAKKHHFIRGGDKYYRAHSTQKIVDETLRVLRENRDKPVYVNTWTLVPHATLHPTPEELAVYADLQPKPEDFSEHMREYLQRIPKNELKERMQIYCATITSLDTALGNLITGIEKLGEAENTLILLASDNGPEDRFSGSVRAGVGSPGPLRGRKRSIYEGGVRSSCIAYWPGTVPGGRVDDTSVLSAVDWFPTVCSIAGATMPTFDYDGEDVTDILKGKTRERTKPLFWEWRFEVRGDKSYLAPSLSVRDGKWKFMCNADGTRPELYDVPADPAERKNLVETNAEVAERLKGKLMTWKQSLPK